MSKTQNKILLLPSCVGKNLKKTTKTSKSASKNNKTESSASTSRLVPDTGFFCLTLSEHPCKHRRTWTHAVAPPGGNNRLWQSLQEVPHHRAQNSLYHRSSCFSSRAFNVWFLTSDARGVRRNRLDCFPSGDGAAVQQQQQLSAQAQS